MSALPNVADQTIVITGASSGFGRGAALALAARGASVVLLARRASVLTALAAECEIKGGRALAIPTDVGDADAVEAAAMQAESAFGGIDSWINVAGVGAIGAFTDVPLADHLRVIQTNLLGTLHGSYTAMRRFESRGRGHLVNVASMLGRTPAPYYTSYAATKSAIITMDTILRAELVERKRRDIHVSTVLPMAFDTPFFQHAANYTGKEAQAIPPVYDASKVVDALVGLMEKPEAETIVGGLGVLAEIAHRIAPGITDRLTSTEVDQVQIHYPENTAPTAGNLHAPVESGTGLYGDRYHKAG